MEWHGEKMLPRGLPELIHQVTPHWIARNLKVITCHRDPFDPNSRIALGSVGWHGNWWVIRLFPTKILEAGKRLRLRVMSFSYWLKFLEVALHEVGHIVTGDKLVWGDYQRRYNENYRYRQYVEGWANWWMEMTKNTIASRDPRLGQPLGWIGGLPGLYLIRQSTMNMKYRGDNTCSPNIRVMQSVRAYRCDGQLTLTDVLSNLATRYLSTSCCIVPRFMRRLRAYVKRAAPQLGITRHYTDAAGRKHLYFNNGEAIAMVDHLREYVSKGDLIEVVVKESKGFDRALQKTRNSLMSGAEISPPQSPEDAYDLDEIPF